MPGYSCPENVGANDICAFYIAKPADRTETTYRLIKIKGEEDFYLIETSMDTIINRQLLRNLSVSKAEKRIVKSIFLVYNILRHEDEDVLEAIILANQGKEIPKELKIEILSKKQEVIQDNQELN